ncbi:MAG TPA: aspartate aminotransferase family protein [Magnetospirillaceae bacterium]|jgi:acetylornithine/N-succinyldiaminopimelate aminotransferase
MTSAVMPVYSRTDLAFERGEGVYLFDTAGRRYLDYASGVAVTALGHGHPRLLAALTAQMGKVWHTSNIYRVPGQERVAAKLIANSFADTVFFCNSGAEAMEGVIKTCRKYQHDTGHPERYRIITIEGAFHGRTLATIAAGGQAKHLHGFEPTMDGFDQVPWGNLNELRAAITAQTAAILVEPVQGEGGVRPATVEYMRGLRQTADEFGLLLAMDEVQTGMGRTGKLFAHEWAGITPDVMGSAKGLGGGFPVGAVLATEKAAVGMVPGTHGSTFGGNPMAMAAAEAVLDVMLEDGFLEHVQEMGDLLWEETGKIADEFPSVVLERRGKGLLLGLKCKPANIEVYKALLANGLVTVVAGDNVVRLLPPLIIEKKHVTEAIEIMRKTFGAMAGAK